MGTGDEEDGLAYRTIVTERLHLKARRPEDELALKALAANPAIAPNLCATIDRGNAVAIVERESGRIVGGADHGGTGLGTGIEVAVWIGESDWGRGFATEAAHALIDRVFADSEGTNVLWCSNRAANDRARRVIEKCGFQYRGTGMVRIAGRGAFPIERFALDRRIWTSLKAWGAANKGGHRHALRESAA